MKATVVTTSRPASPTTSSPPASTTGRNNTLVAESDLEAAYQAMQERMTCTLSKYNNSDEKDDGVRIVTRQLLQECGNSLPRHVARIVQPIADTALYEYVKHYSSSLPGGDGTDDTANITSNDEEEEEYDEEDLVDPKAVLRVQEVRQQIRDQAAAVQAVRAQVLEQAVILGERQVRLWLGRPDQVPEKPDNMDDEAVARLVAPAQQQLEDMRESLTSMVAALDHVQQQNIPDKLQSLQQTMQVIEHYLTKQQQQQQGGPLSQTEQAIFLRHNNNNNVLDEDDNDAALLDGNNEVNGVSPEERLESLLGS